MNKVQKIRQMVSEKAKKGDEFSEFFFTYHVSVVVKYALALARKLGADREVVEIAAWLHDSTIGTHGNKEHNITGAQEAERLMRKLGYPENKIKMVAHAIISHRCKKGYFPRTLEAKILATADAVAHLDTFMFLPWIAKRNGLGVKETFEWIAEKFDRDWEKKIFFPQTKKSVRGKFQTRKKLLDETLKFLETG